MTSDRYADWDAAYVLGALSSADRRDYEEHLTGCAACREAVGQLAGIPGLLAVVEPVEVLAIDLPETAATEGSSADAGSGTDEAAAGADEAGAAPTSPAVTALRPEAGQGERHTRSGRAHRASGRRWLAVAAALVALGGAGAGGYALSAAQQPARVVVSGPTRLAFSPVTTSPMTAVVDVTPVGDRTSIEVECQYSAYAQNASSSAVYSVWAVDRDGKARLVTTWRAVPDRVMHPSGTAAVPVAQLAAIEIRSTDSGRTVMRATLG